MKARGGRMVGMVAGTANPALRSEDGECSKGGSSQSEPFSRLLQ